MGNGHRRHDVHVVRWNHKSDWRWVIGYWVWAIGYWLLAIGDGLFQVFVYGIDANACREETEGSYVAVVRVEQYTSTEGEDQRKEIQYHTGIALLAHFGGCQPTPSPSLKGRVLF